MDATERRKWLCVGQLVPFVVLHMDWQASALAAIGRFDEGSRESLLTLIWYLSGSVLG